MRIRLLYRLLIVFPVTLSILFITLFLFYQLPGSQVLDSRQIQVGSEREMSQIIWEQEDRNPLSQARGLFYFSVNAGYVSDSLFLIPIVFQSSFNELSKEVRNREVMNQYATWIHHEIRNLRNGRKATFDSHRLFQLLQVSSLDGLSGKVSSWGLKPTHYPVEVSEVMESEPAYSQSLVHIRWLGKQNLFHFYLAAIITGHPKIYTLSGEIIQERFQRAMQWTLAYSIPVLLVGWIVVFVIVLWLSDQISLLSKIDRGSVLLYSFPTFVLATLALVFFTSHRFGIISKILPYPVFFESKVTSLWDIYREYSRQLIFPMVLFAIGPMILFYRVFYEKIREIRTTHPSYKYLKHIGLSSRTFRFRYLSRYLLVSTWAVLSNLIVSVLAGSLVIEWIFNIPGVGRYIYESIINYDVASTVYLIFIFTIVQQAGHILSDFVIELFYSSDSSSSGLL